MIRFNKYFSNGKVLKMKDRTARIKKLKSSFKDYSYLVLCLIILSNVFSQFDIKITPKGLTTVLASSYIAPARIEQKVITVKEEDKRAAKLKAFLEKKNSPLAPYSETIITQADKYGLDWTKLIAISDMESKFGTRIPQGSYNAWGIGGSRPYYFDNWEQGIEYASRLLGTDYKQSENQGIKSKYCPSSDGCNPEWAIIVTNTSNDILELGK